LLESIHNLKIYTAGAPLYLRCFPAKISPYNLYGCKQAGGVVLFESEYRLCGDLTFSIFFALRTHVYQDDLHIYKHVTSYAKEEKYR
jgi:hypothetical protein